MKHAGKITLQTVITVTVGQKKIFDGVLEKDVNRLFAENVVQYIR